MAPDAQTVERVRRALSSRTDVVEKRMVGGLSFLVDGKMCCGITGSALMVRLGPERRAQALRDPHVRPMELGGKELAAFVLVEPVGFRTDARLRSWIKLGFDQAAAILSKPPKDAPSRASTADKRFAALVAELVGQGGVTVGSARRGFGSGTLQVHGRIFAMVSRGSLVLKLPAVRVEERVAAGLGSPFDAGKGRPMKEWLAVGNSNRHWRKLADEAVAFVSGSS